MKYEDLERVNKELKTTDIKGRGLSDIHKNNIRKGMIKYWNNKRKEIINKNGYITICIGNKKYYKHRLIMEQFLGRKLKSNEHVHHINENKLDNRIENLMLIDIKEHEKIHAKLNNLGKDRLGKEPINKTNKEIIQKIKELRKNGMYLRDIVKTVNLSYPTVQKYAKEVY